MKTKTVDKDVVEKALASLEAHLETDTVVKASEDDLDQPEGADLGNSAKEKMSDAAKAKKAVKSEDAEEGEDEGEEEEMKSAKKAKKSFAEEMPEEVQTKIDVSEFLKSLVDHTGNSIDSLREYVGKSDIAHEARYNELTQVVEDIQKSQAKIGVVLKAICQQIGVISAAPAREAKSDTVAKSEAAPERQMKSGLEEDKGEVAFKSLSENPQIAKSQIANALCDLVRKGEANDLDVIGFESGGHIRPELVSKLKTALN
jgi:hypothetical protein